MSAALAIARVEIRRFLTEKITLFTTLVMPLALVLIIGTAFGGSSSEIPTGLLDEDGSPAAAELTVALEATTLTIAPYSDADAMARDIRLGTIAAGVLVPAGFGDALERGVPTTLVMTLETGSTNGAAVSTAINGAVSAFGQVPQAVEVGAVALGASDAETRAALEAAAERVAAEMPPVDVTATTVGAVPAEGSAFARAMYTQLTLFIFLNGMLAGIPLVESRRLGVSRRMLSTPTGIGPHIFGVGLGRWGLGLIQAGLLLGVGVVVFGVALGHRATALVLTLLWCALGAAVGMLLGAVARTPDQVVAWSVPMGIGFGMLGGCMWPLSVVPPFMQTIGHLTPHAWAVDAWSAVVDDGAAFADVTLELAVITAVTGVLAGLAVVLLRRSLSR